VENVPLVRSPVDGTVTNVNMQRGDYVTAMYDIVVVAKPSDMYIMANVEETIILKNTRGAERISLIGCIRPEF
jgi:multidrug resistance efflux pump